MPTTYCSRQLQFTDIMQDNTTTRMTLSREHTSAKAAYAAQMLPLKKRLVTRPPTRSMAVLHLTLTLTVP